MATELILKGQVQGVCCRMYCRQVAHALDLRGAASNLRNGDVQVVLAINDSVKVKAYVDALRQNRFNYSFYGHISNIIVNQYNGMIDGDYVW
jgi:acylphosphatase